MKGTDIPIHFLHWVSIVDDIHITSVLGYQHVVGATWPPCWQGGCQIISRGIPRTESCTSV